jgi:hypothetical protein
MPLQKHTAPHWTSAVRAAALPNMHPSHNNRLVFSRLIVKLDDDIIQNYVNESTFEIEVVCREGGYDVQLREIEPSISRYR